MNVTNRQTHRPRYSVCSSRPNLAIVAMRPNNGIHSSHKTIHYSYGVVVVLNTWSSEMCTTVRV